MKKMGYKVVEVTESEYSLVDESGEFEQEEMGTSNVFNS